MRRKALDTIKEFDMLPAGCRVIVGFSGGADSVALLSFLWELRQSFSLEVVACHINHQLRQDEAKRDEDFCRIFCQDRGIPLSIFREEIAAGAKEQRKSVEEYARQVRYERFTSLCSSPTDRIATAHHANDLAETQLFHMARGTGLKGLMGIPPVRDRIIRPLLYCSRQEIEGYCREQGLPYVTDSSNFSLEYSRNRIRHHIIPQLEEINPSFIKSAVRLSKQAALEEDYLKMQLDRELQRIFCGEDGWSREGFQHLHPAMKKRAAAFWLEQSEADVSQKKIDDLLTVIDATGTLELRQGKYLQANEQWIRLKEAVKMQAFFSETFKEGKICLFPGKNIEFLPINREKYKFFANNRAEDLKNAFDYDKMYGIAVVRQRLPGDAIQLADCRTKKSFKKLLNEKKISIEERSRLAVLCDEKGPLWLEGFGIRQDVQPDESSSRMILIRVLKELSI